jgi:acyl-CoA thioester hydrolase
MRNGEIFDAQLRWTDFDAYGHLHSSGHIVLLENARARAFNSVLRPVLGDIEWVLVHLSIDFIGELRREEGRVATCRVGFESAGRSSMITREAVMSPSGQIVSRARAVVALWEPESRTTVELTNDQRAALASLGVADRGSVGGDQSPRRA